jgi:hypothetical protein
MSLTLDRGRNARHFGNRITGTNIRLIRLSAMPAC